MGPGLFPCRRRRWLGGAVMGSEVPSAPGLARLPGGQEPVCGSAQQADQTPSVV